MFTPEERARLRSDLLEHAASDGRISGAAITGSGAAGREDRWSDIDLAFGIGADADLTAVVADWTKQMYESHGAVHHLDIRAGSWLYRVFLLSSSLQVDLAFVPAYEFRPLAPTFRLVSGTSNEFRTGLSPPPADSIGFSWLYAVHARSCIARNRLWQALYMINNVRDRALELACIRHGLTPVHGRGIDQLPDKVIARFETSLVGRIDADELRRAYRVVVSELLNEIRLADAGVARRLDEPFRALLS